MKLLIALLVAAMAIGAADSHAQTTSSATTASTSAAGASAGILANIIVPGSGAAASAVAASSLGTLANPQFVMGQTTVGPSVTSYDACSRTRSGSIGPLGAGWSQTDDDCARQRQAEFARQMGIPAVAYEQMCKITEFADSDAKTIRQCYAIKMSDAKAGTPTAAPTVVTPTPIVVSTNTTARNYPRCNPRAGIVDNCVSN